MEIFAFAASAITILAFLVAVWQTYLSREQTKKLDEIAHSLTTRYLGRFPEYYPDIVDLLESAKEEIIIFCDFPAYGYVLDHNNWIKYRDVIALKKEQGVGVNLVCPTRERRLDCIREQFPQTGQAWDKWKNKQETKTKLEQFMLHADRSIRINDLSKEQFVGLFDEAHQRMLRDPFTKADICEVDALMPLVFWLVDEKQAIFGIASLSMTVTEYGFLTLDQKLISALLEMRNRFCRITEQRITVESQFELTKPVSLFGRLRRRLSALLHITKAI